MRASVLALLAASCLDPLVSDTVDPARTFGSGEPVHVEDDPAFAGAVALFPASIPRLSGFAEGRAVRYWSVSGPLAETIVDQYVILGRDGERIGRPIIDVIPGDRGYSPFWRVVELRVSERYSEEKIWSREGVDLALSLGLLEAPVRTRRVVNCPVVRRGTTYALESGAGEPKWAWYKNRRVEWIPFDGAVEVDEGLLEMPRFPVYVFQRIDEALPIYELAAGVDLDGDGRLDASNNVFSAAAPGPRFSPLWEIFFVRTSARYPSIDRGVAPGIDAEGDFVQLGPEGPSILPAANAMTSTSGYVISIERLPDGLANCPIDVGAR